MGVRVRVEIVGGPYDGVETNVDSAYGYVLLADPENSNNYTRLEAVLEDDVKIPKFRLPVKRTSNGMRAYWSERNKV